MASIGHTIFIKTMTADFNNTPKEIKNLIDSAMDKSEVYSHLFNNLIIYVLNTNKELERISRLSHHLKKEDKIALLQSLETKLEGYQNLLVSLIQDLSKDGVDHLAPILFGLGTLRTQREKLVESLLS